MRTIDDSIVMTLDAGGTNFVFSAIQNYEVITPMLTKPAFSDDLDQCLRQIVEGFQEIKNMLSESPVAISFAFPGPANYTQGIIGDLPNMKAFKGGVALGPYLEEVFNIPVFINNDGNLFAYGEALCGALPMLNRRLESDNINKKYRNVIGLTFGTGFGSGVVIDGRLLTGDNDCGGDVWVFRNKFYPNKIIEESVSARAITSVYNKLTSQQDNSLTPKDVFSIAEGELEGDQKAAQMSFSRLGEAAGDAIAHILTFIDGIVVLGGGLMRGSKYIMPALLNELNSTLELNANEITARLQMNVLHYEPEIKIDNLLNNQKNIKIPYSIQQIPYNPIKTTFIMKTTLGTSASISLGAYAYALYKLGYLPN